MAQQMRGKAMRKKKVEKKLTGKTPFWWGAIERAEKRGKFTEAERVKAAWWNTCACGRNDPRLFSERNAYTGPNDRVLYKLGALFSDMVSIGDARGAAETLAKIEMRAGKLLKKIEKGEVDARVR